METQVTQHDVTRGSTAAAILLPWMWKPCRCSSLQANDDLQDGMEVCQCGVAADEQAAPDEGTDASQDDPQLIDGRAMGRGRRYHALEHRAEARASRGLPGF